MDTSQAQITDYSFLPSGTFRAGRDMPEGSIGWHADCSDNPLDIRPAADIILNAITEKRASMPEDEILIVEVGGNRGSAIHTTLVTMLAKRMLRRDMDFTVSLEENHNLWKYTAKYSRGFPKEEFNNLPHIPPYEVDPEGELSIISTLTYAPGYYSVAELNMLQFLKSTGINTVFSDAAGRDFPLLPLFDKRDQITAAAMKKHFAQASSLAQLGFALRVPVSPFSGNGVAIRNQITKDLTLGHARLHGKNIVLLSCDADRVFGNAPDHISYKQSLDALFGKEAGVATLPVFITDADSERGLNIIDWHAVPSLRDSVVIDGLAGRDVPLDGEKDADRIARGYSLSYRQYRAIDDATDDSLPSWGDKFNKERGYIDSVKIFRERYNEYLGRVREQERQQKEPAVPVGPV